MDDCTQAKNASFIYHFTSGFFSGFPRHTTPSHPLGRPQVAHNVNVDSSYEEIKIAFITQDLHLDTKIILWFCV